MAFHRIAILAVSLGIMFCASAQPGMAGDDEWQPTDKSMVDLLQEGYQVVTVMSPSPQLRVYFLSDRGVLVKCSEEARLVGSPPPPPPTSGYQRTPNFDPSSYVPEVKTKFDCAQLGKSR